MRKAAVRHGDSTTTRGFVIALSSTIHDNGRKVALSGDEATCGNCKGAHKIFGTGKGMSEKGRDVVIDGDRVLCPCGKNRVIVGSNPGIFLKIANGHADGTTTPPSSIAVHEGNATQSKPTAIEQFARRFFVWDKLTGNPMPNRAFVADVGGVKQYGKTDEQGYATIKTSSVQPVDIHIIFASPRRGLKPHQGA